MVQVPWFIADREVATWFEYHDHGGWLVLLVLPVIPLCLVILRSDMKGYGPRGPIWMNFDGPYLEREIELVPEEFLVRCHFESQDSRISRGGVFFLRIAVWAEQSADSRDTSFCDQSCAIFCDKRKGYWAFGFRVGGRLTMRMRPIAFMIFTNWKLVERSKLKWVIVHYFRTES